MAKKRTQIVLIHGGMTFKNKSDYLNFLKNRKINLNEKTSWAAGFLTKKLGKSFEIIRPKMPLSENAQYDEWKIHFERYLPKLKNNLLLIGCSLGGIFLAKYLSENKFQKKILSVYLICPPFDDALPGEDLAGGFKLKSDLSLIEKNAKNLRLLFSKDDKVVPISHAKKYAKKLKNAEIIVYQSKNGHFRISEFPEIVKMIKQDVRRRNIRYIMPCSSKESRIPDSV